MMERYFKSAEDLPNIGIKKGDLVQDVNGDLVKYKDVDKKIKELQHENDVLMTALIEIRLSAEKLER
jgi:hypothetical protein